MKTCCRCRRELPHHCFDRDRRREDGRFPVCKVCRGARGFKVTHWSTCPCGQLFRRTSPGTARRHCSQAHANRFRVGPSSPTWKGDDVGYSTAHGRVRRLRGAPGACEECGADALHWAYDHADPNELAAPEGPYSLDAEHYRALCVPCHKTFDTSALRHGLVDRDSGSSNAGGGRPAPVGPTRLA